MSSLPVSTLTESIVTLLTEAYAGPPNPNETWFIDNEPDSGILGILSRISAEEASSPVGGSPDGSETIAANAEHLRWSLANANTTFRGGDYNPNWQESWQVSHLDEAGWDRLRQALRAEFESLCQVIGQQQELPGEYLNGVLAMIPHAAYHLGVIRQMIQRIRAR